MILILHVLVALPIDDDHLQIDVDSVCYNAVLNAWGWSSAPEGATSQQIISSDAAPLRTPLDVMYG